MINKQILLILPLLMACGIYSMKGTIPAHIQSISISPIKNESTEFAVGDLLGESINSQMIAENILKLKGQDEAHSQLDVIIKSVTDMPYTYSLNTEESEHVDEWKITIKAHVKWSDLKNDEFLVDRQLSSFGIYGTGVDINSDGIDNDSDGLTDSEDSDEYGSPRESAVRIAVEKITELIINEITSTW
ncbi:MAG: hypothetical protein H8E72_02170 [Candidatus Marinimicrobia bacterium]|nr:hypothetical protein [Candidatus Neomarinimicrobiota bacterium]